MEKLKKYAKLATRHWFIPAWGKGVDYPPPPGMYLPRGVRIPDYREFKVDENTPRLLKTKQKIDAKGLHNPWLRIWAWQEHINYAGYSMTDRNFKSFTKGMRTGLVICLLYYSYTKLFDMPVGHEKVFHRHDMYEFEKLRNYTDMSYLEDRWGPEGKPKGKPHHHH